MTFPDFEKLTPQEQLDVLEKANPMECPFWMERLKTAVEKQAPQILSPFQWCIRDVYSKIISYKKQPHDK